MHEGQCPKAGQHTDGKAKEIDDPLLIAYGAKAEQAQVGQAI